MKINKIKNIAAALLCTALLAANATPVNADMMFEAGLPAQADSSEHLVEVLEPMSDLPAFPGADGYAKYITGGRGGKVIHVTNLNDSGEGSFAEAINNGGKTDEPRIIVFDVSGTITLNKTVYSKSIKNVTIAGQTAPGEGITFTGGNFYLKGAENVIIRYVHFRHGQATSKDDSFFVQASKNIMVDHCSFSYGSDEVCSARNTSNLTIQWSLMSNGVRTHSMGGLQEWNSETIHHCLLGNQNDRNPKVKGIMDFTNNVLYNWGQFAYVAGGNSAGNAWGNVINNYFIAGLDTVDPDYAVVRSNGKYFLHLAGNLIDSNKNGILDGVNTGIEMIAPVQSASDYIDRTTFGRETPLVLVKNRMNMPELEYVDTAEEAYYKVLNFGGSSIYHNADGSTALFHDDIDTEIITGVKKQTGKILLNNAESHNAEGEYFTQEFINTRPQIDVNDASSEWYRPDADRDGIPDAWESKNGLNPNNAEDRNNIAPSGYTWIEEYLNELAAPGFPEEDYSCEEEASKEETKERTYIVRLTDVEGNTREYEAVHGENHLMIPFTPVAEYLGYRIKEMSTTHVTVEYPFTAASGLLNIDVKSGRHKISEYGRGYSFSEYVNQNETTKIINDMLYVPITLVSTGMGGVYEQTVEENNVGVITIHDAEVYKAWHNDKGVRDLRETSGPLVVAEAADNCIKFMFDKEVMYGNGADNANITITADGVVYTAKAKNAIIWGSHKVASFKYSDFVSASGKTLEIKNTAAVAVVDEGAFADYYNAEYLNSKTELTIEPAVVRMKAVMTPVSADSSTGADTTSVEVGMQLTVIDALEAMHRLMAMKDINGVYYDEINTDMEYADSGQPQIAGMDNKKGWNLIKAYVSKKAAEAETGITKVEIDMNGETVIPSDVIEAIRGANVELTFNVSDELKCRVNGKSVSESGVNDIDLNINTSVADIKDKAYADAVREADQPAYVFDFEGNEEFGAEIYLLFKVDTKYNNEWAELYVPDGTGAYKLEASASILEDGTAFMSITKASDYIVTISKDKVSGPDILGEKDSEGTVVPTTSVTDESVKDDIAETVIVPPVVIIVIAAVVVVCVAAVIIVLMKQKNKRA
ncbi:MAG: hypothetical protein J6B39_05610 [Lachnospiraceae bacterium]|nr:hypothetical protein [Lachnospiraceae bacterium]